ncbi:uncharacterized protein I206_105573 [Kwoniella pini CBS 10737]|uniref:Uncharacterized protein n=1 Tax=Kwoniella pini CBS 10737 TaxID=1296096 RepID=A0A1B9I3V4_9TREE|nr:uncharacterized protein I206_03524 [Kwoniella pini CBS 10737]OCF50205.1 hypothetical protein I206_03524 [Kwoniella pini CBS 10737]
MEFLAQPQLNLERPKNLYPCLAHIHIIPSSDPKATRRLSTGSYGSDDGNALTRVISGGTRRKSSFGTSDNTSNPPSVGGRRLSFGGNKDNTPGGALGGFAREDDKDLQGKWYWRVQVGVTETQLILLPLTQPPNPVLTSPPAPLSHAMPSHSTAPSSGIRSEGSQIEEDGGLVGKMKNLFRKSSTAKDTSETINTNVSATNASTGTATVDTTSSGSAGFGQSGQAERVIDQTPRGEMLPSAKANEMGATNLNANAETGYPGIINGNKLNGIVIPLQAIDKSKVVNGGGKKGEGSWVTVPVLSHFSHFAQSALSEHGGVGSNKPEAFPKSGYIKFEFDKDWIGAKGESELLHHHLTHAINVLPENKDRQPHLAQFHLGGHKQHTSTLPQTREYGPNDESAFEEDDEGPTGQPKDRYTGTGAGMGTHGSGMGLGNATETGMNDMAAGVTGDQGIALGHPVHAGQGGSLSGSSVSGKVGGESV